MKKWWRLLIGLTVVFALLMAWRLAVRWELPMVKPRSPMEWGLVAIFVGACALVASIPAFLCCAGILAIFRNLKQPSGRAFGIVGVTCLVLGLYVGVVHVRKWDRWHELHLREEAAQGRVEGVLEHLERHGKYDEMVQEMERVLAIHEETVAEYGLRPWSCNHGDSYFFIHLYPASADVPGHLGSGLSWVLFDRWRMSGKRSEPDRLSKAMTRSKHPLLRALGYWVEQDYVAFEREALAGAAAGDKRFDALALVAACAISKDRKLALETVGPILDRGIGLGGVDWATPISSSAIRAYLEGSGPAPRDANFMDPPGFREDRSGASLHFPAVPR